MEQEFDERVRALVLSLGLGEPEEVFAITPLTGGVSSEIALVDLPDRKLCVKFALEQLKVEAEWHAPVRRNLAEFRWLEYAAQLAPKNVPQLYGHDEALGGFAMEFVSGDSVKNWKADLLRNAPVATEVTTTAQLLGEIHAHSASDDKVAWRFDNRDDFHALRIEPYLESLAPKHPDLATAILEMAAELGEAKIALVHGDVSPKNILFRSGQPIILDAECATIGDPVFDVAFCLNHFLLKGINAPHHTRAFFDAATAFYEEYTAFLNWEHREKFEARLARLLPMLLLARVDGKSPVEYLELDQQEDVRRIARAAISSPTDKIAPLIEAALKESA